MRWVSLRLSFFILDHAKDAEHTQTANTQKSPTSGKIAVFCFLLSLFRPLHACGQLRACACAVLSRLASIAKTGRRHFATIQIQAVCLSLLQSFLNTPLCGRQIYPLPCMFSTLESAVSLDYGNSFPYDSFPYCKRSFCERKRSFCESTALLSALTAFLTVVERPFRLITVRYLSCSLTEI